jgi:hypothetical protein
MRCGSDDLYACTGNGVVYCNCAVCPGCLEFEGHAAHCPDVAAEKRERVNAWVDRVSNRLAFYGLQSCTPIDDSEGSFSWHRCDLCRTDLGGNRTRCNGYNPETGDVVDVDLVCDDCILFLANGDLPDLEVE